MKKLKEKTGKDYRYCQCGLYSAMVKLGEDPKKSKCTGNFDYCKDCPVGEKGVNKSKR